jgi:peptidoglycan/xylan/chitin deacetylase (PgdA/CDA1 family)
MSRWGRLDVVTDAGVQGGHKTLAILGYHKIGEPAPGGWKSWFYIPEAIFAQQLSYLHESGWQVIDAATALRGLAEPEALPERSALITFDDGYRSLLNVAVPVLRQFACPAVVFVPTSFIGRRNDFDVGVEPEEAICDWDDLRELERVGVSVQSHTATHPRFSDLDLSAQQEEVIRSKAVLEEGLGKPVEILSYPFNDAGRDPAALAITLKHMGYQAACLYKGGPNPVPIAEPYLLKRIPMGPDTDLRNELRI